MSARCEKIMQNDKTASPLLSIILSGAVAALFSFSLPMSAVLIFFVQLGSPFITRIVISLSVVLTLIFSLILDIKYYRSDDRKSAYPIAYFLSCIVFAAAAFLFTDNFDFVSAYGISGASVRSFFMLAYFTVCAVNSAALLFRIVFEFITYIKSVKR